MNVVEIGCGEMPGPYFANAQEHIVTDISPEAVTLALAYDSRFTPLVSDAASLDQLANATVDTVLARNVFGDPHLGIGPHALIRSMHWGDLSVLETIRQKKIAIMQEAARLLLPAGRLVIVEQYSPMVAADFIKELDKQDLQAIGLTTPHPTDLQSVVPSNFAEYHARHAPQTWVSYPSKPT